MKAISLLQPWASLVVMGAKKIETRSWNTKYRGELLIHASLGKDKDGYALWHSKYCWDRFTDNKHFVELPFGAIIGKVSLLATVKSEDILFISEATVPLKNGKKFSKKDWKIEIAFGDYSAGRYAWLLSDPVHFKTPIPCKGSLSIWDYPHELPGYIEKQV